VSERADAADDAADDARDVQLAHGADAVAADAARAALVERRRERLRIYLATMIGDDTVAEDLTQESFRRAFEKLSTLEDPARFGSWITSIAVNLCRDHLRARVREHDDLDEVQARHVRHGALTSVMRRESAEVLARAIDRLPILLREAFVLFHVQRCSYRGMAELTGASEGALQVRCHRAKALLRRQLGDVVDTHWGE
jgi:RNA polymerase sigma-70 factor (ECF subfamily)